MMNPMIRFHVMNPPTSVSSIMIEGGKIIAGRCSLLGFSFNRGNLAVQHSIAQLGSPMISHLRLQVAFQLAA